MHTIECSAALQNRGSRAVHTDSFWGGLAEAARSRRAFTGIARRKCRVTPKLRRPVRTRKARSFDSRCGKALNRARHNNVQPPAKRRKCTTRKVMACRTRWSAFSSITENSRICWDAVEVLSAHLPCDVQTQWPFGSGHLVRPRSLSSRELFQDSIRGTVL